MLPMRPSPPAASETSADALDLREKGGLKNGEQQFTDKRLFMQLQVFSSSSSIIDEAALAQALQKTGVDCVLYQDANDPRGVAVLALSEKPEDFLEKLRPAFGSTAFRDLAIRREFSMFGRTYALGYEADVEDWLVRRPCRVVMNPALTWALWYPLRRTGEFAKLSKEDQGAILREHGGIGRKFGAAGFAEDIRLNSMGLDTNDNDFVIGIIGKELYPLSALIQTMRATKQTSTYIEKMGPFLVGKAVWRSKPA
jgi:chlorite dismutase